MKKPIYISIKEDGGEKIINKSILYDKEKSHEENVREVSDGIMKILFEIYRKEKNISLH